ncbi:MAG: glycoside hydrolase family 27 protein, partial [Planctomycetes bacterium]|nr:glycoside hydrolase family 27 protein [Planctomycetota bacterium]
PWTCAGYAGAYLHEQADAKRFADWGFDFLKYDWCSYSQVAHRPALDDPDSMPEAKRNNNPTLAQFQEPYKLMGDILRKQDRDIVYNLCQYGMGEVWKWGGDVGGNCWRTTGDLGLERDTELPGFYSIGFSNMVHWENAAPGRWNDPDYILIGWVGAASQMGEGTRTKLTAEEQYSYMSMWCLMAAPLIFSGDMAKLDPFTLNVLCNAEVIEVDQDPLGRQARPLQHDKETLILAKSMADGSLAIGLFNLTRQRREVGADWALLGLKGPQRVRDLWRQKDLSPAEGGLSSSVGPHGVMLLRLWPRKDTP